MDVKEYISSGILESYSLGLTTDQETREVECLSSIYPELQERLVEIDSELIAITEKTKLKPDPEVKERIFAQLDKEFTRADNVVEKDISRNEKENQPAIGFHPLWTAASVLLAAALLFFIFKNTRLNNELEEQAAINQQNQQRIEKLSEQYASVNKKAALITDARTQHIALANPTNDTEQMLAEVYWNASRQQFLLSNHLPDPPQGKQYQFWAIVNGQPQDMGVIPIEENAEVLRNIEYESVDAFAITLENEGGSETPTLDQMKAIAELA